MLFLDSNICIVAMKGDRRVASRLVQHIGQTAVSTIVVAELRYGASKSSYPEANHQRVSAFLRQLDVVYWSEQAAEQYGQIRTQLQKAGQVIGERDMLIAAAALADNATLVTHNTSEFQRVDTLKVLDWLV